LYKIGLAESPDCPYCNVEESANHALFDCERFQLQRHYCSAALSFYRVKPDLDRLKPTFEILTGDFSGMPHSSHYEIQNITSIFLSSINKHRSL